MKSAFKPLFQESSFYVHSLQYSKVSMQRMLATFNFTFQEQYFIPLEEWCLSALPSAASVTFCTCYKNNPCAVLPNLKICSRKPLLPYRQLSFIRFKLSGVSVPYIYWLHPVISSNCFYWIGSKHINVSCFIIFYSITVFFLKIPGFSCFEDY